MTLENEGTGSLSDASELDLISAIGIDEPEATEPEEVIEQPVETTTTEEEPEPDPKEEIARLQRIIATDPAKRAAYEAEKYGVTPQAQAPQQIQQPDEKQLSMEDEFAAKFPGEEFDPFNIKHQAFLQQLNLRPAFSYIEQTQAEEKEYRKQQAQEANKQAVETLNKGVHDLFIKGLPVVADILKAETLDYKQEVLISQMESRFQQVLLQKFPERQDGSHLRLWTSPEVHKEIVREIMPTIKQLASDLGLAQGVVKKTVDQQVARETYVESSNAVPSSSGNPFDDALAKGDIASALGEFSKNYR